MVAAICCVMTQVINLVLILTASDVTFVDGHEAHDTIASESYLIRNSLSSLAAAILTIYNVLYSTRLIRMSKGIFKDKVRTKILL